MRYHIRPRHSLAAAGLAAALALAGCGGENPVDPAAGATPAPAAPTGAATPTGPAGGDGDEPAVPDSLAFTATTVGGQPFDAATLAGEPVVLWFWAPWCTTCRAAAPDVLAAAADVTVVGVGGLDQDSAMQGFLDATGTGGLTHLADADGQVWQRFGVINQHTYVLIDAAGEVVHTGGLSGAELRDRAGQLGS